MTKKQKAINQFAKDIGDFVNNTESPEELEKGLRKLVRKIYEAGYDEFAQKYRRLRDPW